MSGRIFGHASASTGAIRKETGIMYRLALIALLLLAPVSVSGQNLVPVDRQAIPLPGNYGFGLPFVTYENGIWRFPGPNNEVVISWGCPSCGDVPVPWDYDGDGITDIAVYRPPSALWPAGEWFVLFSSTSEVTHFGRRGGVR